MCAVLERAMSKDPADRQSSAEELGVALRSAAEAEGLAVPAPLIASGSLLAGAVAPLVPSAPPAVSDDPARVALAVATPVPAQQPLAALELLNAVQPELPERILSRMRRDGEVTLVFKVNPDGSVADLNVQASNSAVLDAIVLDAVRQWRYKPIAQARTHRVQFVFKRD